MQENPKLSRSTVAKNMQSVANLRGEYFFGVPSAYYGANETTYAIRCQKKHLYFTSYNEYINGTRLCPECSRKPRNSAPMTFAYIHKLFDITTGLDTGCIKFGITNNPPQRLKTQSKKTSKFKIVQHGVWEFPSEAKCIEAENATKANVHRGVIEKQHLPDGHSETCYAYNIDLITAIYERREGKKISEATE